MTPEELYQQFTKLSFKDKFKLIELISENYDEFDVSIKDDKLFTLDEIAKELRVPISELESLDIQPNYKDRNILLYNRNSFKRFAEIIKKSDSF